MFNKKQKEVEKQSDKTEEKLGKLDDLMNAFSPSTLAAVAGITGLVKAVQGLTSVLGGAIDNYAHFESMQKSLETFFQDADKGKEKFEELRRLSNETTYGVDELADSFSQLANVGVAVDSINEKLVMLGNVAGGNKQKFADLVSIYSKIQSTGRAGSMQIQQLARQGIPIYEMLKKIGVQGTATGDDITKAFQEMTKEGGQFYNAMNNINETIEGKEGFISDYFKEMSVNFAEVTGLADAYKDVLDVLKDSIASVSDWLLKMNENPIMKAIISGAFYGILTALVGVIAVGLIGALKLLSVKLTEIIAKLTIIQMLSGPAGWAVLAVAGITAVGMAMKSYSNHTKEAEERTKKLAEEAKKLKDVMGDNYNLLNVGVLVGDTAVNSRDRAKNTLEGYQKNLEVFTEKLNAAKKDVSDLEAKMRADGGGVNGYENRLKIAQKEVDRWREAIATTNGQIKDQTSLLKFWEDEVKRLDVSSLSSEFEEIYDSIIPKEQREQESLTKQLEKVYEYRDKMIALNGQKDAYGNIVDYDKSKQAIDDTIRYLKNKLAGVNAWEDVFRDVTGISVPKVGTGDKSKGQIAGEDYIQKMNKMYDAQVKANIALGGKEDVVKKEVASDFVKEITKQIKTLLSDVNVDEVFKEGDSTIQAMFTVLNKFKDVVGDVTEDLEKMSVGQYASNQMIGGLQSASGDFSAAAEGAQSGGVWGAVIGVLINALWNVASECENFSEVMNPITTAMEALKPIIQFIIDRLGRYVKHIEAVFTVIGDLFEALTPIIDFLFDTLEPLNMVISAIGYGLKVLTPIIELLAKAIGWLLSNTLIGKLLSGIKSFNEDFAETRRVLNESKDEEIKRMNALTDAYSSMPDVLKDIQEEYEKRKKFINARGYSESVTGVHDMILTPHGKFSTDPDDYIIATKNPSGLNGGGKGDIIINNYSNAQVEAKQDDMGNTIILISQKVAMDFANGNNGWENAVMARQARSAGRNLAM